MENTTQQFQTQGAVKQNLDGATAALVCGIISIPFAGLIGAILAIIAIVKAGQCKAQYNANPALYNEASLKNANAGKICGIISLCLFGLTLLILIAVAALS